ncbi:MAG TPA: hypothetical protein PLV80_13805 [Prolixibacteraceae bacterium]|nr:hypothetical protein [Prolixibacteraceae bacterium]HPL46204.1 hypothetical protein [Prolixibacteraceae bacterium]HQJ86879.1 hypothetical protein [Prolixibacteraceae bacterium]
MSKTFFNFPVRLLQGAFDDIASTMDQIIDYATFVHASKLDHITIKQRMNAASDFFGIRIPNPEASYRRGQSLFAENKKSPMTGIKKELCFDFMNNHKTTDEIAVLLGYLAVKSILGNKPYACITNSFLIARMGGYSGIKDLPANLPQPLASYSTRRKLDRLKQTLMLNWGVNIYSHLMKGFYISMDSVLPLEKLIIEAEKRRNKFVISNLKKKTDEARQKALMLLSRSSN